MDAASAIIETAIKFQRHGRLEEAEAIYREILKIEPSHVGAMHNLGLVFHSNGKYNLRKNLYFLSSFHSVSMVLRLQLL